MTVAHAAGISPRLEDIAIAATGTRNDLTALTVNDKDFRPLGVRYLNPLESLPG